MAVTPDEVRRVADLAGLELGSAEVEELVAELNGILKHVDALQAVRLEEIPADDGDPVPAPHDAASPAAPTSPSRPRLRSDEPGADPLLIPPAELAPGWRDGYFTVVTLEPHRRPT